MQITPAGKLILTSVDGRAVPVTVEEYKDSRFILNPLRIWDCAGGANQQWNVPG